MEEVGDTKVVKSPCECIDRFNISKMSILSESACRFNATSTKISMIFFTEIEKNTKIHIEASKAKNILEEKNHIKTKNNRII